MKIYKFLITTGIILISLLSILACNSSDDDIAIQDNQISDTTTVVSEPSKPQPPKNNSNTKIYSSPTPMTIDKNKNYKTISAVLAKLIFRCRFQNLHPLIFRCWCQNLHSM